MANINLSGSISATGAAILGSASVVFATDANHTLSVTEYTNYFLEVTSSTSLTTTRNLIAPLVQGQIFLVQNNTSGGQAIQVIGSTGTGAIIPSGLTVLVACDGANYFIPYATSDGGTVILFGDVTGSSNSNTVIRIDGYSVNTPSLGVSQDGYLLTWDNADGYWTAKPPPVSFMAGGDLSGTNTNQNVINIHGASVPIAGALTTGNVLQVTGVSALSYAPVNLGGGANYVTGTLPAGNQASQNMGGDVTGTTASNTVVKIQGNPVSATPATAGQFLIENSGATGSTWTTLSGDVTDSASTPGKITVVALQGNPVTAGTLTSTQDGYALVWNNTTWSATQVPGLGSGFELELISGIFTVPSTLPFTRIGSRVVDLTKFPTTFGSLNRTAFFIVDLQSTPGGTTAEVRLLDITPAIPVQVTGTDMTVAPTTTITELNSGSLTVGSSPGNIRGDVAHTYEVDVRLNGGTTADTAIITGARLIITYQ